jgi:hypothetical protein
LSWKDSDALYHQFGVKLAGAWDLQVVDQVICIQNGQRPPEVCPFVKEGKTYTVPSMQVAAARLNVSTAKLPKPHVGFGGSKIWTKRPLADQTLLYAAGDVQIIREMFDAASKIHLSNQLQRAAEKACRRYESVFRDCPEDNTNKSDVRREEHPIISSDELPASHPRLPGQHVMRGRVKWDETVAKLKAHDVSNTNSLYNDVTFIVQHDAWYTAAAFSYLRKLCTDYPYFSGRQLERINNPPKLQRWEDDDDDGDYSYDDL